MSPQPAGRPLARCLLVSMILAIGLGPRIRLPGLLDRAVDLRVQDFLLVAVLIYVGTRLPSLRPVWGPWFRLFVASAPLLVAGRLLFDDRLSILRTTAYFGRAVEAFILAIAVAGLYRLSGPAADKVALRALLFAVAANTAWVGYQYVTGTQGTVFGEAVADKLTAYGPQLVGEGSAFGTGFFFLFTTALGVAMCRRPDLPRRLAVPLIVVGVVGAYLSGSRLSLVGAMLCAVIVLLSPRVGGKPNVLGAVLAATAAVLLLPLIPHTGRISPVGVEHGLNVRISLIWRPMLEALADNPLWGIGPGRLGTDGYPWTEAHNVLLRAGLDYGIVVGAFFLAIFVTAMARAGRDALSVKVGESERLWGAVTALAILGALVGGMVQETLTVVTSTHLIMLAVGLFTGAKLGPLPDARPSAAGRSAELLPRSVRARPQPDASRAG